ncbi:efflux RND transporter periplasmic adaptor subunit [Fluoribacter dumoffii]|uniref:Multidrug resistance protein MdtE n=1 Tax=Fluoribacter dumoffii TaxID=463 RepID=A0A377GEA9_9GAMM|nr:efflux RND transporter periplasmic adaptor subunit [Fluoribacter dumoffii]KTC90821.1 hemolysin D [Fluoribacter dumoffii NY 23]MCW8386664.1 efflux RND transporter periplasmic adaptor subunit [Fluoribacter dumoffii]MCW8419718.1 efflux RND transporter periplasmic adaptor subunit [Fluoribacter dumoffii]MCW8455579.1 efflux RND transporter periplasmic adaptor subunit [Fluoribacter dumoffii]MCW8460342.1 efflux RND transporter periplasmic adaptor subunit [Fluoribacter dumoffii]
MKEIFLKKQMIIMLIAVGVLFALIFGWKAIGNYMMQQYFLKMKSPPVTVSTMKVEASLWQPTLRAVGNMRARLGVNVTTELAGMVQTIYFTPGTPVKKGTVLVQLNADTELGQLHSLQAQVELAKITYNRDKAQYAVRAVSKQTVDADEWNLKNLQAQVAQQTATVEKKTIRAPFTGQLGINNINPGQYLNVGDTVTTLQALDPIYVDFYLPQQELAKLELGQNVRVVADTYPDKIFQGKITTIEPIVDSATRNVEVEATLPNPDFKLKPGMFTQVEVETGAKKNYLTLPQSAISFNPYGDIVYLVKENGQKDQNNKPILVVKQVFVTVGDTRGDQIAVLKGLHAGDIVVTSGQLKLKNGSQVLINNTIQPSNEASPKVVEK